MSQVRKLLQGNNIPKAQEGYKFRLDSQDVYFTDDDLKEIDNQIAALPMEYRRFLGNATTAIKEGNQSGNRAKNTVTMQQLSGLNERNSDRLRKQKAGYWEAITNADSYVAKEAINLYLQILASVANKSKISESESKKIGNSSIRLDFNKDKDGKYSLSPTAGDNFSAKTRIEQIFEHLNAGENSPYDVSDWDLTGLTGWWNGLGEDKSGAAKNYLTDLWTRMSTPGYEWGGADEDFLRNFEITWKANDPAYAGTTVTNPASQHVDEDGKIKPGSQNPDGTYGLIVGDGKNGTVAGALYTTWVAPDARPYLLNEDRIAKFGLDPSYLNGIIYKSRIYRPEEVSQNVELQQIMDNVITANNSATSADDVWANVGKILNFTDYDNPYVSYNSSMHYMPNRKLREALGEGNYSIFNPTAAYEVPEGLEIFGVYDFNNNGEGPWNFRTPRYYISGNGTFAGPTNIPEDWKFLNRNWSKMNGFAGWENIRGKYYGLVGQFWGSDAHDTTPYTIYEDTEGIYYTKLPNGNMQRLDDDLALAVITGKDSSGNDFKPNHNQMLRGTLSGRARGNEFNTNISPMPPPYQNGLPISRKQGGKVELKPLPFKLQMGSRLAVAPNQPEQTLVQESPLAESSNLWETLTPADQKEIIAAGIDVAGAIAGLIPGGSVVGAASGILGSTPLFMEAAKERKGHLDAGDWGQAALATGLDLVSLIPYLGETGKVAKIAKAVTRVAVPLGKAFSLLGLSQAASVLAKDPKDWDTNDLLKLSAGIQSVINIGHGAYVRHGESALASEISKIKGKPGEIPHSFKIGDTDIELTKDEIKAISDPSNNPEEILQGILRGRGVSDEQMTNLPQLLERFGFNTKTKGWGRKKRTVATVKEPEENPEYTKSGWFWDEFLDPLGNREFARRAYIDNNLTSDVRAKLAPSIFETSATTITNPRETITTSRVSPKNNAEARAYIQSLARQGQAETSWFARPRLKSNETITVDRTPGLRADAEAAIARGEGLPNTSEMAREAGKAGTESMAAFAESTRKEDIASAVSKALGARPTANDNRAVRLGANAVSNKELRKYIIGNAVEKGLGTRESVEFLNQLSQRKRKSLLNELRKSKSKKAQDILSQFDEDGNNLDLRSQRLNPDRNLGNVQVKRGTAAFDDARLRRKNERYAKAATNIKKLQESKDPMKTLSELLTSEQNFAQQVLENSDDFQMALNYALSRMPKNSSNKYKWKNYNDHLAKFLDDNNLVIFNKKGGIIKAQNGVDVPEPGKYVNIGTIDNPIWRLVGPDGNPILVEGDLGYSVQSVVEPTGTQVTSNETDSTEENQVADQSEEETSTNQNNSNTSSVVPSISSSDLKTNSPTYRRIGNVELNKIVNVNTSPLAKQEIVKVSGGNNLADLILLLRQLNRFKKGGIIKGQSGITPYTWKPMYMDTANLNYDEDLLSQLTPEQFQRLQAVYTNNTVKSDPIRPTSTSVTNTTINTNWKPQGFDLNYGVNKPSWQQGSLYPSQPSTPSFWPEGTNYNEAKWNEFVEKSDKLSEEVDAAIRSNNNGFNPYMKVNSLNLYPYFYSSNESKGEDEGGDDDEGGGPNKDLSSKLKKINPLLSLARFGVNAYLQRKYRDTSKDAINAARFNELPVRINTARTDSPELDRALQQINSERMAGIKPVTSDLIANNALWNQREAQLYDRERQLVTQRSQYQKEMDLKNLDIMNQNIQNEISVANSNRARNASLNSALYNADLEYIQRRGQSIENLGLEIQNNIKKDIDLITAHNKIAKQKEISDATDKFIDSKAPGWRAKYNALTYNERIKYSDFLDYLERNDPNFGSYREEIEQRKKQDQMDMLDWMYQEGLNYSYPSWIRGTSSSVGIKKKGGYINGSTRYTKEPDEQIWIDNNKATHRAIGKLSDNTIKLLLRALK